MQPPGLRHTWLLLQTVPQVTQLVLVVRLTQLLLQQPWPALQQLPLQATCPDWQVRHAFPEQPFAQVVTVGLGQFPLPSQTCALVCVPLVHTCAAPHEVPDAWLPVSMQTEAPVEHDVFPVLHVLLFGKQVVLGVHAEQTPAAQNMLVPQPVPSATFVPVSAQACTPVLHEVFPAWQGLVGVHTEFAVQATQACVLLHTMLVPHDPPTATLPLATQVEVPVVQDVVPVLQGLDGEHANPDVHDVHTPPLQTRLVPHAVPSASEVVESLHTGAPVAQLNVPLWQVLVGVQAVPLLQAAQAPALQTMAVPHDVPAALLPLSTQTETPVAHEVVPVLHGLLGWQATFAVHETHCPVWQTRLVPHAVPSDSDVLASTHVGAPVPHASVPLWQGLALGVQGAPLAHATQLPLAHTRFVPQLEPLAALPDVTQAETPVEHDVVPALHMSVG